MSTGWYVAIAAFLALVNYPVARQVFEVRLGDPSSRAITERRERSLGPSTH